MIYAKVFNLRWYVLFFLGIFAFDFSTVVCQDVDSLNRLKESFDAKYGLNQHLYNGRKYINEHPFASGFPEWKQKEPFTGDIVIAGIKYPHKSVRYNLYKQFFVLQYKDLNNAVKSIILNNQQIDTVKINNSVFVRNYIKKIPVPFIEIILKDTLSCFITWKKDYSFDRGGIQPGFYYSDEIRQIYLLLHQQLYLVKNRRTLFRVFEKNDRRKVRKYLAKQDNKISKMNNRELKELIEYCNNLIIQ